MENYIFRHDFHLIGENKQLQYSITYHTTLLILISMSSLRLEKKKEYNKK